jgi:hypothetical protein
MQLQLFEIPKVEPTDFIPRFVSANHLDTGNVEQVISMLLDDAEELFGTRVPPYPYTYEGVYFGSNVSQLKYRPEEMKIFIRLSSDARNDNAKILWQLAHECTHLLTPARLWTSMLEEGLACWFQMRWAKLCPQLFPESKCKPEECFASERFLEAYTLVEELLKRDPQAIKRCRKHQPVISKFTPTLIVTEISSVDVPTAKLLCSRFARKK